MNYIGFQLENVSITSPSHQYINVYMIQLLTICQCFLKFANLTITQGPPHIPLSTLLEHINLLVTKLLHHLPQNYGITYLSNLKNVLPSLLSRRCLSLIYSIRRPFSKCSSIHIKIIVVKSASVHAVYVMNLCFAIYLYYLFLSTVCL